MKSVIGGQLGLSLDRIRRGTGLTGGPDQTGQVTLDILDIVQTRSKGVVDVDNDDLPISLTLVEESHDSEDLDLPGRGVRDRMSRVNQSEREEERGTHLT
jgi:hypothetical protein